MTKKLHLHARLSVVVALLVALVSSAWAHRVSDVPYDAELGAYLAAGGLLEDICADGQGSHQEGQTCDACRLVDTVAVPDEMRSCRTLYRSQFVFAHAVTVAPRKFFSDPSRPVRAPPLA